MNGSYTGSQYLTQRYLFNVVISTSEFNSPSAAEDKAEIKKMAASDALNLWSCYFILNCIPETVTAAEKAITHNESDPEHYFRLAISLQTLCMFDQSIARLQQGIRIANSQNLEVRDQIKKQLDYLLHHQRQNALNRVYTRERLANDPTFSAFPISLAWEGDKGRTIVATKDIPKGTVVMRVAPFNITPNDDTMLSHCSSCLRNIKFKLK
ncbi:hypothetical protein SAMD00019534_114420 [Acytostelium subglobosum LB1]|uniref:hypothetical protein n=1 Tax=Acytostelium subglobosum LB1 TaxID=1410327 RepID=UPI000644FD3B|nr:hypothetical protein SAMD00019534_114420 [Acytostelium subglobosum LB1]GAM28266.1 hypothetical protein SAMD00019534_114420 [Acytostelium subglobosum LB1]|eukprot:XP_012748900.1 hypothetical protein SAMD00019534_114420 [Acytostelium subglobosum LB1]